MPAEQEAARLAARIGADTSGLVRGFNDAHRMIQQGARNLQRSATIGGGQIGRALSAGFSGGLGGMTRSLAYALPAVGALYGVGKLAQGAVELAIKWDDVAQAEERAWENWQRMAGPEAYWMMSRLREVTHGAVEDTALMAGAYKLLGMGIAGSAKEAVRQIEIATQLGMAYDKGPKQAIEDWTLMMANQSKLRLDTFGISMQQVEADMKSLQATQQGLSNETAFYIAVMNRADEAMERVGVQVPVTAEAWAATLTNLKRNLAVYVADTAMMQLFSGGRSWVVEQVQNANQMLANINE
jgi:hypothetical protein